MPELVALSGKVSEVSQRPLPAAVALGARGRPTLFFRVADRRARFVGTPDVGEGDLVTIAGLHREGTVSVLAIRNRSTGVDYGGVNPVQYLILVAALVAGVLTLRTDGVGLLFLGLAAWWGWRVWSRVRALALVRSAGPVAPAAEAGSGGWPGR